MGKLDNNSLVIVGDGEMRNALMKKAKKMHKADNIIFLGAMENPLPILKKSSTIGIAFLFRSLSYNFIRGSLFIYSSCVYSYQGSKRDIA